MRDLPISFGAPMVKALLAGTKTQTRRVLKFGSEPPVWAGQGLATNDPSWWAFRYYDKSCDCIDYRYLPDVPRIKTGDRCWVKEKWSGNHAFRAVRPSERESFATPDGQVLREDIWYWADGNPTGGDYEKPRPSLFMPRYASRITLLVDDVKVERLQDISEDDAIAEGIVEDDGSLVAGRIFYLPGSSLISGVNAPKGRLPIGQYDDPRMVYRDFINNLHGGDLWTKNPWLVCYRFKVVLENIDFIGSAAA